MSHEPRSSRPGESEIPSTGATASGGGGHRWQLAWTRPCPDGWLDVGVALVLATLYVLLLLSGLAELGYARDEGFYFVASQAYETWFQALWADPGSAMERVDSFWRQNNEHPALIKSLFALSHLLLQKRWQLFDLEGTSFRFPAMVLAGVGVGLVYLWGARARSRLCGAVAAVSLAAMPRFFFHAHLACFDAPIVTMWTLCAYAYWRSLERAGWWWPVAVGLSFGLALNTKHNSWFLPIVCGTHAGLMGLSHLVASVRQRLDRPRAEAGRLMLRRAALSLAAMATLGPLLFWAMWPWLWHDTWVRLQAYANFHLHHVYYNMEFLGRNYFQPPMPRSYAFVMTAATVPAITLLLFAWGLGRSVRPIGARLWAAFASGPRRAREGGGEVSSRGAAAVAARGPRELATHTLLLWLLAMVVQYAAWLSPETPIFGGTKHWMTAYPFLVLFAGVGLQSVVKTARAAWSRRSGPGWLRRWASSPALDVGFAMAVLVAPVVEAVHAHPWGLSAYSPLVGGAAGGATLGLNRGFWGYTTGAVADYLNGAAPRRARVYVHDTAAPSWQMLRRDGRVRRDLRTARSIAEADIGLYHHEKHMSGQEYQNWVAFQTTRPDHIAGLDGVPVIWVYRAPEPKP